jgi:NAD(P)-dependent dehydrogenase (short-subunit alcohol dehydrogenase family)
MNGQCFVDNPYQWLDLQNRVFVVTGAAGGIGGAIAAQAAAAGARVALLDRDGEACVAAAQALTEGGYVALPVACDTASAESVAAAASTVANQFGACEILANAAGIMRASPTEDLDLAQWNAVLAVNLSGYFLTAQAFGSQMTTAKRGSIVHVASITAHHPQTRGGSYGVSKSGVVMLSKQLAAEWGPSGIRSNVVSPGLIRTPLTENFYRQPGVTEQRARIVPSRRIGSPQDIADCALFLASDRAAYVNGAELIVDGGLGCVLMDLVPRPGFDSNVASTS